LIFWLQTTQSSATQAAELRRVMFTVSLAADPVGKVQL